MLHHADVTFCIDNEALFDIWFKTLKLTTSPEYEDLNHLISLALSGITTSLRFPGQLNAELDKLFENMVPIPHLHFFAPIFAPLISRGCKSYRTLTVPELTQTVFDPGHVMTSCNPRKGRYITLAATFRGKLFAKDVNGEVSKVRRENDDNFVGWFPHNIKTTICEIPPVGLQSSSSFLGNTTSIQVSWSLPVEYIYVFWDYSRT